jgi:hypothetical protein
MSISNNELTIRRNLQLHIGRQISNLKLNNYSKASLENLLELMKFLLSSDTINFTSCVNCELIDDFKQNFLEYDHELLKNEFNNTLYATCMQEILSNLYVFMASCSRKSEFDAIKDAILSLIIVGNYEDTFDILYDLSTSLSDSQHRDFCLYLLRQYLSKHMLKQLFIQKINLQQASLVEDQIIQRVVNLPDKLASKYANSNLPYVYVDFLVFYATAILRIDEAIFFLF